MIFAMVKNGEEITIGSDFSALIAKAKRIRNQELVNNLSLSKMEIMDVPTFFCAHGSARKLWNLCNIINSTSDYTFYTPAIYIVWERSMIKDKDMPEIKVYAYLGSFRNCPNLGIISALPSYIKNFYSHSHSPDQKKHWMDNLANALINPLPQSTKAGGFYWNIENDNKKGEK
jgi:hypothetical protein